MVQFFSICQSPSLSPRKCPCFTTETIYILPPYHEINHISEGGCLIQHLCFRLRVCFVLALWSFYLKSHRGGLNFQATQNLNVLFKVSSLLHAVEGHLTFQRPKAAPQGVAGAGGSFVPHLGIPAAILWYLILTRTPPPPPPLSPSFSLPLSPSPSFLFSSFVFNTKGVIQIVKNSFEISKESSRVKSHL